jgi:cytochrome P450
VAAASPALRAPGPPGHLLVGNLPEFARDLLGFFENCAWRYGDVVAMRLGRQPACLINHPDIIESVLVTRSAQFVKHSFFWRHVDAIFGNGLLTSEGEFWLRQRRLAQPAFHRERVASYGAVMVSETEEMLARWGAEEARDIHEEMMGLTMRIVAKTLFGTEVASQVEDVGAAFEVVIREIAVRFRRPYRIPDWVPLPSNLAYRRAVRRLDQLVYQIIRERGDGGTDGGDLMAMLLRVRDEDGSRMTERQLRDEAVTIFLAGRSPAVADLPRLRYTEAVVLESMRLYPPAYALGREALGECEIGAYRFPAGTTIFASPWVMHRDPRYFERPAEFDPGRWADGLAKRLPRFAYFPFGGGPRLCIGNAFAMMEATLILAAVVQQFRLGLEPGHVLEPFPSITLRPRHGVRMRLARRA